MKITTDSNGHLVWHCLYCAAPIAPGAGYVGVDPDKAQDAVDEQQPYTTTTNLDDVLADLDNRAEWGATHTDTCNGEAPPYALAVADLATPADVIAMTGHLIDKPWIYGTDWGDIVALVARALNTHEGATE